MNLKKECDHVGLSVSDFCKLLDVPYNTLNGWSKSRPQMMRVILNGISASNEIKRLQEFNVIGGSK